MLTKLKLQIFFNFKIYIIVKFLRFLGIINYDKIELMESSELLKQSINERNALFNSIL